MEKYQINKQEFMILIILCIIANDKISGVFGAELKQNKLVAYGFSLILSIIIFSMYYFIFKNSGFKSFGKTFELLLGKIIGKIILTLYFFYFLFISILDTRDIMQFVHIYLLDAYSPLIIRIMFISLIIIALLHGIESIARFATIQFNILLIFFFSFNLLMIIANLDIINFKHFVPLLEDGIKPLIKPTLFMTVSIPFGELFILMVLFHGINNKKRVLITSIIGQLIAGFMVSAVFVLNLLFLSPETLNYMLSPALRITRRIDIQGFLQRLDLIVLLLMTGISLIKICLFIYGAKQCLTHVFKIKKDILIYCILGITLLSTAQFYYPNYIKLIKISVSIVMPYINSTFEFFIPLLLFIISFIKRNKLKQLKDDTENKEKEPKKTFNFRKIFTFFAK